MMPDAMTCKFCGCTDETPCLISDIASLVTRPCAWLIENVCDAPACVEKAYAAARLKGDQIMLALLQDAQEAA